MDDLKARIDELTREAWADPRTTDELIAAALMDPDGDAGWDAVSILHRRGTREVFEAASQLCRSECPVERRLGAAILGQSGTPDRTFPKQGVAVLLRLLETESDEGVLHSACIALGHNHDPVVIPALCELKAHPSAEVRFGVALGLGGYSERPAVEALIGLTTDPDDDVRDWATFALGTQIDADTPEIREALFLRTADADEVTRGEALIGLARRRDPRVVEALTQELSGYTGGFGRHAVEAAEVIADPRLLPVLIRLKQSGDADDPTFDEAIARCSR